jgi:hypothetical protein
LRGKTRYTTLAALFGAVTAMVAMVIQIIAMATHGHGGLKRWVIGSVTDRVLHATKLPLLVVRPRGPANVQKGEEETVELVGRAALRQRCEILPYRPRQTATTGTGQMLGARHLDVESRRGSLCARTVRTIR